MPERKFLNKSLFVATVVLLATAFVLTFTVSDYYIFNRISQFGVIFCVSQWVKKAGLLLIAVAVFLKRKSCADVAKYFLPIFVILSCFTFGEFFNVTKEANNAAQEIYNSINLFIPKQLNVFLFFLQNAAFLFICVLLFIRDGFYADFKKFIYAPISLLACIPLNIFENFFDINLIPQSSFLRFYSFTVWHLLAVLILIGFTLISYYFLKRQSPERQDLYMRAAAIVLLIQYHSKNSVIMGDGYNIYHTVFACVPLFICNLGVYVASISVFLKKKILYSISFFIHAAGALTVFFYFGKDEMSNYGIFCSYSILYFCLTHCLLFVLSIMPSALGQYKFSFKHSIVPLVYYFVVIITASVASALVTSASTLWHTESGIYLSESQLLLPNYAFTQINPLPIEVPPIITLTIWKYELNVLYVLGLYAVYVALFFAFIGCYYAFLKIRKKVLFIKHPIYSVAEETAVAKENEDFKE